MQDGNWNLIRGEGWVDLAMQAVFVVCSFETAVDFGLWPLPPASMAVVGILVLSFQVVRLRGHNPSSRWQRFFAQGTTWLSWIFLCLATALLGFWLGPMAGALCGILMSYSTKKTFFDGPIFWKTLILIWTGTFAVIWVATGFKDNSEIIFYGGLLWTLWALIISRRSFQMRSVFVQCVNTIILLLVLLPITDAVYRITAKTPAENEVFQNLYSYERANGSPERAARAHSYYENQVQKLVQNIYTENPHGPPDYRLRPGSSGYLGECLITINSNGFRGPEISDPSAGKYRIVILGESTTFGMTFEAGEKPWPELLQEMIRSRLKTRRPVEVINAGMLSYTLGENLRRMPWQILPLKPALLISYHGANGFHLINMNLLRPHGFGLPDYKPRPIKLIADAEYRIRLNLFRQEEMERNRRTASATGPMKTRLAADYRKLIQLAANNQLPLVLANYSMAVNTHSSQREVNFFQQSAADSLPGRIQANEIQSQVLENLAAQFREVTLINTHPGLDGMPDKFLDYMHLSLAENVFAGISNILVKEIGQ